LSIDLTLSLTHSKLPAHLSPKNKGERERESAREERREREIESKNK
jgi:hypothetical protein